MTIVVQVLMTSCHVSEKPKIGPVRPHTAMDTRARTKTTGRPEYSATLLANLLKPVAFGIGYATFLEPLFNTQAGEEFPFEAKLRQAH